MFPIESIKINYQQEWRLPMKYERIGIGGNLFDKQILYSSYQVR
jgi:hypothetical protein